MMTRKKDYFASFQEFLKPRSNPHFIFLAYVIARKIEMYSLLLITEKEPNKRFDIILTCFGGKIDTYIIMDYPEALLIY